MTTPLEIREVPGYANKHPGLKDQAYLLEVLGDHIGLLYVTPEAYTLAWPGSVDFGKLEHEAGLAFRAALGLEPIDLRDDQQRKQVTVSFILPVAKDEVKLHEYHLGQEREFKDYSVIVRAPADIAFARYDFADSPRAEPFFSFISENKAVRGSDDNEVAVKLLRSTQCSTELLEWIVGHHHDSPRLRSHVDLARSAVAVIGLTKF
jgi:hypothetical protein